MKVLIARSCLTLCDPMDCSPPGSSVYGILQAKILEWVGIPFSPTQVLNWSLLHCRQIIYHASHQGSPNCFSQAWFELLPLSVQFSHSVVSDSLQPHESQHARPPCPSPSPGVHPDLHPSCPCCHPAISSSVFPFSSCPPNPSQPSESFPMSQLFA